MPDIYIKDTTGLSQTYSGVMSVAFRLASNMSAYADYYYGGGDTFGDMIGASNLTEYQRQFNAIAPFVSKIRSSAFTYTSLTYVSVPNCSYVGYRAFWSNTGALYFYGPAVTSMGDYVFYEGNIRYASLPLLASIPARTFLECNHLNSVDTSATYIGAYAFASCHALQKVPNASNILGIENGGFNSCWYLLSAALPNCSYIRSYAFQYCTRLSYADLPKVSSIPASAFNRATSLATLYIGSGLTSIVTLENTNAFTSTKIAGGTGSIYVPSSLLTAYKAAANWSAYSNYIYGV